MSRRTVAFVAGVFGIAAPQVASQPPHGWAAWILLIAGAMVGGLIATGLLSTILDHLTPGSWGIGPPGWRRVRSVLLPIVVLVIAVVVGMLVARVVGVIRVDRRGCSPPAEVPVVASPETFGTATDLAQAFELWTARARRDCPSARLSVYAADPAQVSRALVDRWSVLDTGGPVPVDYLRDLGPRPQLWMPDSTVDVDELTATVRRTGFDAPLGPATVYGWTPLVLAVPQGVDVVQPSPTSWRDLLEAYHQAGFTLVSPAASASVTGRLARAATYPSPKKWSPAELAEAQRVESLLTAGQRAGYPPGDAAALLRRYQSTSCDTTSRTALVLPEQFVLRPSAAGRQVRDDLGCRTAPRGLVAINPEDTPVLNRPLVSLNWGSGSDPASRTAAEFGHWLGTDAGHRAIEAAGLHSGRVRGLSPGSAGELDPALVTAVDRATVQQARVARPVELLLAIDTSGSMATRVTLGTAVLNSTAARLSDGDRLGLLTFGGGANGVVVRVPSSRAGPSGSGQTGGAREAVRESLAHLRPAGATPLRRALSQGVSALLDRSGRAPGSRPAIRALVVLTDGRDTVGGPDPAAVADRARAAGVRVLVLTTGSADCSEPTLATVVRRSGGRCLVARDDAEPTADALAAAIWAGPDE